MSPRLIVEADGGSRGNPGPAGCGAVVRDAETGALLAERALALGITTNNVAEYEGLIAGLRAAVELGADEVDVRMDSKLVVEQMSGRWRVKHANLKTLASTAAGLVRSVGTVRFEWIPRADNADADRLANEAMDGRVNTGAAETEPTETEPTSAETGTSSRTAWLATTGTPTRLVLLRHGQTPLSVDRRYSGRGDVALTDFGRRQAEAAGKRLAGMEGVPGAVVLTSPLARAQQTARTVAEHTGGAVAEHESLIETDFGQWEGLTFAEAAEQYATVHRSWLADSTTAPPGGESLQTVFDRVRAFRDEIVRCYAEQTVIVVSHVTPIKVLLRLGLDAGPSLFYRLHLDLASLSIVDFYPDGNASVSLVNDVSHLG